MVIGSHPYRRTLKIVPVETLFSLNNENNCFASGSVGVKQFLVCRARILFTFFFHEKTCSMIQTADLQMNSKIASIYRPEITYAVSFPHKAFPRTRIKRAHAFLLRGSCPHVHTCANTHLHIHR